MADVDSDDEFEEHLAAAKSCKFLSWPSGGRPRFAERLLHQAVLDGREKRVRRILAEGNIRPDDLLIDSSSRRTCLFVAAAYGFDGMVSALCDAGAAVDVQDTIGWTPASLAFFYGRESTLALLKTYGASDAFLPVPLPGTDAENRLRTAALTGDLDMLQQALTDVHSLSLVVARTVLSAVDDHGRSPLSYAAMMGHEAIVRALLCVVDKGVELDVVDRDSLTPLALAVRRGHVGVARCLLLAGADVTILNGSGHSLLQTVVCQGNLDGIRLLLTHAPSPNFASSNGKTALIEAVHMGHREAIEMILKLGGDVNYETAMGYTALIMAAYRGHVEIARTLLRAGADVNHIARKSRRSALHFAVLRREALHVALAPRLQTTRAKPEGPSGARTAAFVCISSRRLLDSSSASGRGRQAQWRHHSCLHCQEALLHGHSNNHR